MRRPRNIILAGLGAMALPLPSAAAQPATATANVCGAIARIAAAARERPAFGSLRRALAGGQALVPGFAAGECTVRADGVECQGRYRISAFHNWPELETCPGLVAFEPPLPRGQFRWPMNRSYRLGRFLVARGYRCPGCRALGPSYFFMTFYRPGDRHQ